MHLLGAFNGGRLKEGKIEFNYMRSMLNKHFMTVETFPILKSIYESYKFSDITSLLKLKPWWLCYVRKCCGAFVVAFKMQLHIKFHALLHWSELKSNKTFELKRHILAELLVSSAFRIGMCLRVQPFKLKLITFLIGILKGKRMSEE